MKIGIFLSTPPGYSETFFRSKIKGLQEKGMEVYLFCHTKKEEFTLCPVVEGPTVTSNPLIQTWYFLKESIVLLPYLNTVLRYIKLERKEGTRWAKLFKNLYLNSHLLKADLDWVHFGFATMALNSETVAKAIGAKMAVSFRGFDVSVYPGKHPGCYNKLWRYVDKVHTLSHYLVSEAQVHGLPPTIAIEKITPAVDLSLFQSDSIRKQNSKLTFITIGRLHWIKNYVQILEALAMVKAKGYDFEYKIIGEGAEWERIAFAAYDLGIQENVKFLGKIPHSEVRAHLVAADVYLQYSIQEGFCNAVLEAQAMGKLCIVSNAEGLSENVLHGETGWVVPKYSPQALAERIQTVLELPQEQKTAIANNAQRRVREEFNLEKQEREFLDFYGVTTKDTEKAQRAQRISL